MVTSFMRRIHGGQITCFFLELFTIRWILTWILDAIWRICFCLSHGFSGKLVIPCLLQIRNYDMCIAKNEEALAIDPNFAECYGNMANAWKVVWRYKSWKTIILFANEYIVLKVNTYHSKMDAIYFAIQEKGDVDLAIRYYLTAIQVCFCCALHFLVLFLSLISFFNLS